MLRAVIVLAFVSQATPALAGTVVCAPGGNLDVQACLDSASPGDEVAFEGGTYTLDPSLPPVLLDNRGGLTLTAQSATDPPVFECVLPAGALRPSPANIGKSGINVRLSNGTTVPALAFENLHFRNCASAIGVFTAGAGGSIADVQVRGLVVENSIIGVWLQGVVTATVEDNEVFETERSFVLIGAAPRAGYVLVSHNELHGPTWPSELITTFLVGVQLVSANGLVSENEVAGFDRAFGVGGRAIIVADNAPGSFALSITDNELHGNQNGLGIGGTARATGEITRNEIKGSGRFGIAMVLFANGWTVHANEFKLNSWADVFLIGDEGSTLINQPPGTATHDNTVIVYPGTVVLDADLDGSNNNTIIVEEEPKPARSR